MEAGILILLTALVFAAALLYASVGHGGGSGYLAAMALVGIEPMLMKPTALALNVLVATIATIKFARAGFFSWNLFWPFAALSVPLAFVGGSLELPRLWYQPLVGVVLLYAAYRLARGKRPVTEGSLEPLPTGLALGAGALLGLLSGLTGVGGAIFLSPLLLLGGWATARTAAGVAAAFVLVNSISGLMGHVAYVAAPPDFLPLLAVAAVLGGWIGAEAGSRRLAPRIIIQLLALVLLVAGLKMIFTAA